MVELTHSERLCKSYSTYSPTSTRSINDWTSSTSKESTLLTSTSSISLHSQATMREARHQLRSLLKRINLSSLFKDSGNPDSKVKQRFHKHFQQLENAVKEGTLPEHIFHFIKTSCYHLLPAHPDKAPHQDDRVRGGRSLVRSNTQMNGTLSQPCHSNPHEVEKTLTITKPILRSINDKTQPDDNALLMAHSAKMTFFSTALDICRSGDRQYPLSGLNKALVFSEVEGKVFIGLSESRNREEDIAIRRELIELIAHINSKTANNSNYQFILASPPTNEEYYLLRDLHQEIALTEGTAFLPLEHHLAEIRARCAEVSVAYALHTSGLAKLDQKSNTYNFALVAVGADIYADDSLTVLAKAVGGGKPKKRSSYQNEILQLDRRAYICDWDPCPQHCQLLHNAMFAVAASGALGSFLTRLNFNTEEQAEFPTQLSAMLI